MHLKQILFFGFLFLSSMMDCSDKSNQFKRLKISNEPYLRLATSKDIASLQQYRGNYRSWPEELKSLFSPYVEKYNYCKNIQFLANFIASTSVLSSVVLLGTTSPNNKLQNSLIATAFGAGAYKMQSLAKDYAHDQELLAIKCTIAFNKDHLSYLEKLYQDKHKSKHLDFLSLIAARKKWITESQK